MWKQIYEALKQLLLLTQQTERNRGEIKELRQELQELTSVVERLAYEVRRARDDEAHEREKMTLRLENEMLKFERRISGKTDRDPKGEE
jgi:predicted  nucleic acid-binding Zn-ribbon protein